MNELNTKFSHEELHEVARLRYSINQNIDTSFGDLWPDDGFVTPYENTFSSLLGADSFHDILNRRQNKHVLDLFGGGYFLGDSTFESMTALRLQNVDTEYMEYILKKNPNSSNWNFDKSDHAIKTLSSLMEHPKRQIVEGNAYNATSWNILSEQMKESNIPYFDLIVCRPHGPFNWENWVTSGFSAVSRQVVFQQLLMRACRVLSPDSGLLYSQIPRPHLYPESTTEYRYDHFDDETTLTVSVDMRNSVLKIERNRSV